MAGGKRKRSNILAKLRDAKEGIGSRADQFAEDMDNRRADVFDEVDDSEYAEMMEKRRADDFVVDDEGGDYSGYYDDDIDQVYESEGEEDDAQPKKKSAKPKRSALDPKSGLQKKDDKPKKRVSNIFLGKGRGSASATTTPSSKGAVSLFKNRPSSSTKSVSSSMSRASSTPRSSSAGGNAFLDDLLADMQADANSSTPSVSSSKKRSAKSSSSKKKKKRAATAELAVERALFSSKEVEQETTADVAMADADDAGAEDFSGTARAFEPTLGEQNTESPSKKKVTIQEPEKTEARESDDFEDGVMHIQKRVAKKAKPAPVEAEQPPAAAATTAPVAESSVQKPVPTPMPFSTMTMQGPAAGTPQQLKVGKDEAMPMYWFDAIEIPYDRRGIVYVFGKVLREGCSETSPEYDSICLHVEGIERNVYFLPKPNVSDSDFLAEIGSLCQSAGITERMGKFVERSYAFEQNHVHRGKARYYKLVYSVKFPALELNLRNGEPASYNTISHVFGAHQSVLELFLLKRKIMGPSWLTVANAVPVQQPVSWCRYEMMVQNPKDVKVMVGSDVPATPPVRIMSLYMKTLLNEESHQNEIVTLSAVMHSGISTDGPTPNYEKGLSAFTIVRKLSQNSTLPFDWQRRLQQYNSQAGGQRVEITATERSLLTLALAKIHQFDPDVVIGHNWLGFDLDVLLHRLAKLNLPNWSRLGRLRRTKMPKLQTGAGGMGDGATMEERQVMGGRLVLDTYISCKEHLRESSYSLTELAASQLNEERQEIERKLSAYQESFSTTDGIFRFAQLNERDAWLSLQLMMKLQLLPLTKQLTTLAGNVWSRTCVGGRAERIEYLLLHEFHALKYIVPDKQTSKQIKQALKDEESGEDGGGRRKPQYAGGLVLEPKKGLYDKFVLLLDFNSLYPSIIQEYSICHTTVDRPQVTATHADNEDPALAQAPVMDVVEARAKDEGYSVCVLPKVLRMLVDRRRQVKKYMKNERDTVMLQQLDIRQKALKITANSMYGCLGFRYSRFYAQHMAELITRLGRETLQRTVELTQQQLRLDVIYGDTDSIMVNTGLTDLHAVRQMGEKVKREVNQRYKHLEIDIDGIYQRILLLKKKKYAALMIHERPDLGVGKYETKMETKGLDLVRRDWCEISREVSRYCLEQILSEEQIDTDQVVERVHDKLRAASKDIREGNVPLDKFVITKSLQKAPELYPQGGKGQPHVRVALWLRENGRSVQVGERIPFVICADTTAPTPGQSSGSFAERAQHPDLVRMKSNEFPLDTEWYLSNQIHPPVNRLCQYLEGTDSAHLADCLGLDTSRFHGRRRVEEDDEYHMYAAQQVLNDDDEERFRHVERFAVRSPAVEKEYKFPGVLRLAKELAVAFKKKQLLDGESAAGNDLFPGLAYGQVVNQLQLDIRRHCQRYYQNALDVEDASAQWGITSNQEQKDVKTFTREELDRQEVRQRYPAPALYAQLQYWKHLFDMDNVSRYLVKEFPDAKDRAYMQQSFEQRLGGHVRTIDACKGRVDDILACSKHHFVQCSDIFSFYKGLSA